MTTVVNDYMGGMADSSRADNSQLNSLERTLLVAKIGQVNDKSRLGKRAFVVSDVRVQQAETSEQLTAHQNLAMSVTLGGIRNSTTERQAPQQQPLVSGISSHT